MVAADNWDNRANAIKLWKFGESTLQGTLVTYMNNWNINAPNHVSHGNASATRAPEQQYACGSGANRTNGPRANEVICFPLDGSLRVLVVAPVMVNLDASGGGDDYEKLPKGNLDVTGEYFVWTSNAGGNRLDAFLVRVPGHLLTGTTPGDTEPPNVDLTSPAAASVVAGPVTLSAQAGDNVGVAGVQFKVDGANIGAEIPIAPYERSWTPTAAQNGPRIISAVARDAAGNATTSSVNVVVDTMSPAITNIAAQAPGSSATITWTTNESADSQVEYGLTVSYGSSTPLDGARVLSHSMTVNQLAANTTYHYRVKSRDAAGHLAVSSDRTFTTGSTPPPPPPTGGPLAHWTFDEGTGTTAADASGGGHAGSLINGPVWTGGQSGQAIAFDGSNDHVAVAHAAALNAFPLTVTAWIKTASASGVVGIVNKYVAGSYNGFNLFMNNGDLCAWYLRSASNHAYDGGGCTLRVSGYNDNRWHHVAYVVDATSARLFVDGALRGTQGWTGAGGPVTTAQPVQIARYPGAFGGAEYFAGALDDVRIYNRALTQTEIAALAPPGVEGAMLEWPPAGESTTFDGIDDQITFAHTAAQNAFPMSISAWFRTTSTTGVRGLVNKYVGGSYNGYNVFFNNGALCAWFLRGPSNYVYDGGGCTHSTPGLNDGAWHHVVYVVDAAGAKLYVDGALRSSRAWTGAAGATTSTEPLRIGRYPGAFGGAEFFNGSIDRVRLFNRALTGAEVQALFTN
jgi:hypothetical protein